MNSTFGKVEKFKQNQKPFVKDRNGLKHNRGLSLSDLVIAEAGLIRLGIICRNGRINRPKVRMMKKMAGRFMIVTAWNNGHHYESGAGYEIKIQNADRDQYFRREWGSVTIELDGFSETAVANVDMQSFWNKECRELISTQIGLWLREKGLAPWPKRKPPDLILEQKTGQRFRLSQK